MKIARYKKAQRAINFYKNNFQFRDPLQVLIDATFCQQALQHKINIREQLPKYLQTEIKFITSQCIIIEADGLGSHLIGATQIVKQFFVHKCGHEKNPKSAQDCIISMVKGNNYIVATQDRELQELLRHRVGQPLIYLHHRTPVLEQPSEESKKFVEKKINETLTLNENALSQITVMKDHEGCFSKGIVTRKKRFKRKEPNPLSCKKKKKKSSISLNQEENNGIIKKKRRQRIKISKDVKLMFKTGVK